MTTRTCLSIGGILAALALTGAAPAPVIAPVLAAGLSSEAPQIHSRLDQGEARREMHAGNQLSLREIEKRIVPQMKGSEYLGPSYDSQAHAYRLKFIRDGRVTYIDVDARTGRILKRSR